MGYRVYKCDECDALLSADGGAFLAHKKTKHNSHGYCRSKVVAVITDRKRKYEFRDVPQEKREEWTRVNGKLELQEENEYVYVIG